MWHEHHCRWRQESSSGFYMYFNANCFVFFSYKQRTNSLLSLRHVYLLTEVTIENKCTSCPCWHYIRSLDFWFSSDYTCKNVYEMLVLLFRDKVPRNPVGCSSFRYNIIMSGYFWTSIFDMCDLWRLSNNMHVITDLHVTGIQQVLMDTFSVRTLMYIELIEWHLCNVFLHKAKC